MKAVQYQEFKGNISIEAVPDPIPHPSGVVVKVEATGICRSDWHGWMGHDKDITLPHVPGHELAGTVVEIGKDVSKWKSGDRVTVPFVCGCGHCQQCISGNQQVCDHQFQPGFTHWGSFAEFVAINYADVNLVMLPEEMSYTTAAALGCRFITSFRAMVHQGKIEENQWVAIHGCGGIGLSAIMIAKSFGANVIAVDIGKDKLQMAQNMGADLLINANEANPVESIIEKTNGGVHLSMDALGSATTAYNSVSCLRKRGKHVQVGLIADSGGSINIPLAKVIANELELLGSHGMQAHKYPEMMKMIADGKLEPQRLIGKIIELSAAPVELIGMGDYSASGITVIDKF